ncbi:MAG: hypothetical protein K2J67_10125, partial [Lachnospiraceae bacterium]|nr:hypothetical protein [Lachnospiraceae bacterium]
ISYCMLFGERYRTFDKKQEEAFSLTCNIATVEIDITAEQADNVLKGYENLANDHSLTYAGIEDLEEQKILSSKDIKQGIETLSPDDVDKACKLINNGELCFVMRNRTSLQEVYRKLTELCNKNGFEICVNDHKEINERNTAVMEKRLYILIRCGSIIFSTLFLSISIFLWFDIRKHEWFIRNICGQSVQKLLLESTKIILSSIVIAYIITVLTLTIYKPASIIHITEYGLIGSCEAVLCMMLLSIKYSNIKR